MRLETQNSVLLVINFLPADNLFVQIDCGNKQVLMFVEWTRRFRSIFFSLFIFNPFSVAKVMRILLDTFGSFFWDEVSFFFYIYKTFLTMWNSRLIRHPGTRSGPRLAREKRNSWQTQRATSGPKLNRCKSIIKLTYVLSSSF